MINIIYTENYPLIDSLLTNPLLYRATTGKKSTPRSDSRNHHFKHLLITDDSEILGCFQYKEFTNRVVEVHINLLPKYWGKGISEEICSKGIEWFRIHTNYKKIMTDVPKCCNNVVGLMSKINFRICGLIVDGCIFNNKDEDLLLFEGDI